MMWLATRSRRRGRLIEAEPWLRRAADAGDTEASTNLALLLTARGELDEAEPLAAAAAEFGNARAMNVLGVIKLHQGQPVDAETWFREAAMAGDEQAANNLLAVLKAKAEVGEEMMRTARVVSWRLPS